MLISHYIYLYDVDVGFYISLLNLLQSLNNTSVKYCYLGSTNELDQETTSSQVIKS